MALPSAFDPKTGKIRMQPVINIGRNSYASSRSYSSSSSSRPRRSYSFDAWDSFNDGVADIGNWFADHSTNVSTWICSILAFGAVCSALYDIVTTWMSSGLFSALLHAVCIAIVGSLALGIAFYVILLVVSALMYTLRMIFWNGWTLLIALLLGAAAAIGGVSHFSLGNDEDPAVEDVVETASQKSTATYRCTAGTLNVRALPSRYSVVIGTLKQGETAEVSYVEDGFYRIDYQGRAGYVSAKYMAPE